jgi:hypothetical protein
MEQHSNGLLCICTSRDTKLNICRIMIEHAQASVEFAIQHTDDVAPCQILVGAGSDSRTLLVLCNSSATTCNSLCEILLHEYRVDPFLEEEYDDENEGAASPFLAAALRLPDTSIFEYFFGNL